jgi:type II secretory pathway component HofQ
MNINEINKLYQIIIEKDNKIKELELKLQKNNKNKIYIDDMMVVNFMSTDQAINTGIACTADDSFAEVEEKLYQIYDEYRNTNNLLLHKGNMVLRFKKIKENNIKNGDKIIVKTPE